MSVLFPSLYKAPLFLSLQIHTFPYFSLKACLYHCGYISGSKHKTLSHMNKGNLQLSMTTIITTCVFLLPMHQRLQMFPVTCYILSLPFWDPFLQSICTYPSDLNLESCFSMCCSPVFMTLPLILSLLLGSLGSALKSRISSSKQRFITTFCSKWSDAVTQMSQTDLR